MSDAGEFTEGDWAELVQAEKGGQLEVPVKSLGNPFDRDPVRVYYAPDMHWPYQNQDAVDQCIDLSAKADVIVQIGDGTDAYQISSHSRNPARKTSWYQEVESYMSGWWEPVIQQNPRARRIQLWGNHEERHERYLWKQAPELADVPGLALRELFKLDLHGIESYGRSGVKLYGLRAKHGDVARAGAGASAKAEMEAHRASGVSGHTHRYGIARRKDKEGVLTTWYEIGHCSDLRFVEYVQNPDWNLSAGLTVIHDPDGGIEYVEHRLD